MLNFNVGASFLNGITKYIDGTGSYLFLTDFQQESCTDIKLMMNQSHLYVIFLEIPMV